MEFLVRTEIVGLAGLGAERVAELREEERQVAEGHIREGTLLRVWGVPGRRAAMTLWRATDADELNKHLSGLPFAPFADVEVSMLCSHYLEEGPAFTERT